MTTICQWFLMCLNPAVGTVNHPILGDVPICDRCADVVGIEPDKIERFACS